ncbi:hypothetical protein Goshw_011874, partial [Gossypium schwendimanii]|nr:hypothetical protein [Gossypium schwendimanii]
FLQNKFITDKGQQFENEAYATHLRALRKGELNIRDYVTKVNESCDTLAACASPVSEVEPIATILNGLSLDYDPFMVVITSSRESFTLESVVVLLLDVEFRQRDQIQLPIGINMAQRTP